MTRYLSAILTAGFAALSAAAQDAQDRWYFTAGGGLNALATLDQDGYNYDDTDYPTLDFSVLPGGEPAGFRWHYVIETENGPAFQAAVGRAFESGGRLELRYDRLNSDLEQATKRSWYVTGDRISGREGSTISSDSWSDIGELNTDILSLNVYYDIPVLNDKIVPYLGYGIGVSFVEITDVYFESEYVGTPLPGEPAAEHFNNLQDVDISGSSIAQFLSAGVDLRATNDALIGIKWRYAKVGNVEQEDLYQGHPQTGMTSITRFSGMSHWSLAVEVKYLLGG